MSTSSSNLPAIILAVIVVAILVAFYIADRSSGTGTSSIAHSANTSDMISAKEKYETQKSVYSHSGYSGSLEEYLHHSKMSTKEDPSVKEHSGYSGSGKDYVEHHQAKEDALQQANADHHRGFSGSLKEYISGDYKAHAAEKHHAKSAPAKTTSSQSNTSTTTGYSGSVDKYLKKFGG